MTPTGKSLPISEPLRSSPKAIHRPHRQFGQFCPDAIHSDNWFDRRGFARGGCFERVANHPIACALLLTLTYSLSMQLICKSVDRRTATVPRASAQPERLGLSEFRSKFGTASRQGTKGGKAEIAGRRLSHFDLNAQDFRAMRGKSRRGPPLPTPTASTPCRQPTFPADCLSQRVLRDRRSRWRRAGFHGKTGSIGRCH